LALVLMASAVASEPRPFSEVASSRHSDECLGDPGVAEPMDATGMLQRGSKTPTALAVAEVKDAFRTGEAQTEERFGEGASTNTSKDEPELDPEWLEKPFKDFSIQCSHNTFLHGSQYSNTVDASAVYTALELGYRCVEIDVYVEGGNLVVHHDSAVWGLFGTTNRVRFKEFVKKIKEWCEQDERKNPDEYKLPLIINIQNGAKSEPKLKTETYEALGPRIVMPKDFTINTLLKKLAVRGQGKKRKVLLRSTKLDAGSEYSKIVAISKLKNHGALTTSKETGFTNKRLLKSGAQTYVPSDTNLKDVAEAQKDDKLVRTYPHHTHTSSVNYKPFYFFKQRAQMICINFQGMCHDNDEGCPGPIKGDRKGGDCTCLRDVAAGLEFFFEHCGYDGYVHIDSLSGRCWDGLAKVTSGFMYPDEWKHGSRRRLPTIGKTAPDWKPFTA